MVAADSNSGSEPEYSEPNFSDSDDEMGHAHPPLQNVQSGRDIVDNFVRCGRGRRTWAIQRAREQRGHRRGRQPRLTILAGTVPVLRPCPGFLFVCEEHSKIRKNMWFAIVKTFFLGDHVENHTKSFFFLEIFTKTTTVSVLWLKNMVTLRQPVPVSGDAGW